MTEQLGLGDLHRQGSTAASETVSVPEGRQTGDEHGAPQAAGPKQRSGGMSNSSYRVLVILIFLAYMLLATALYYFRGVGFITPDKWVVYLFFGALILGQGVAFLRDWIPFVFLVFGYEYMRGLAGNMVEGADINNRAQHTNVVVTWFIHADRALFGGTDPTLWIQHKLYTPGHVHWYDIIAGLWYMLHFVLPCVFGFMLWIRYKERFWQFTIGFLFMTYSTFGFFLFFPSAPPWLASNWGYLKGIQFPFNQMWSHLMPNGNHSNFQAIDLWTKHSPNDVAAFPSLHAAFPWLVTLFAIKFYGKWGAIFLIYNPILWFSVVYSGNHWVIDILAGIAWATFSFFVVQWVWPYFVRGIHIPVPRPIRTATAAVTGTIGPPINAVWSPVKRTRSRLTAMLTSPFTNLFGR